LAWHYLQQLYGGAHDNLELLENVMSAKKSGGSAGRQRAKDSAAAAQMAKDGVKRTTYRDPITNKIVPIGRYPGKA
jgi:hypothetical protein